MRRVLLAAALVLAAVQVGTASTSQACEPGDLHGYWLTYDPTGGNQFMSENGLKMEVDGYYVGYGSWKLQIDRPLAKPTKKRKFDRIVITSPADGVPGYGTKGVLKKGDTVKGWAYGPAGSIMFGNLGCV